MGNSDQTDISTVNSWRQLKETFPISEDAHYFDFKTSNGSNAHLVVVNAKSKHIRFRPIVNKPTAPTSPQAGLTQSLAAVNGGYFNLNNGESTSYVVLDSIVECDPHGNPALMTNPKLHQYLDKILNRTEVRFCRLKNDKTQIQICAHNEPLAPDVERYDALQAGPRLLPELTDRQEAFVRREPDGKEIDSIGAHMLAARTAFGTTPDGYALILCIAGSKQEEFSTGASLADVAMLLKSLGCDEAMNFDGGTSTTMVISAPNPNGSPAYKMVCGREPETRVKSILAVEPIGK
ncbi:MAG TPA: phosphodiester glycosidase family protein [Planktothrix sp.]